jgi:hypothetical protein
MGGSGGGERISGRTIEESICRFFAVAHPSHVISQKKKHKLKYSIRIFVIVPSFSPTKVGVNFFLV